MVDSDLSTKATFIGHVRDAFESCTLIKVRLGKYRGASSEMHKLIVSLIELNNKPYLQFKYRYPTKDVFKNYDLEPALEELDQLLGNQFLQAGLFTSKRDFNIEYSRKGVARIYSKKPSITNSQTLSHNRQKKTIIDPTSRYLELLGVTTEHGHVRGAMYSKFRQIDKFVEIFSSLVRHANFETDQVLRLVDFGSGKSYLTFAAYWYLESISGFKVKGLGIERRAELVEASNKASTECGFNGLEFIHGEIESTPIDQADIVFALHACDCATDYAIARALKCNAKIILLAPCCHKLMRKSLELPEELSSLLDHGILKERFASELTDGLRALYLRAHGYETKVFEFISSEHTDKNIMISAVRIDSVVDNDTYLSELHSVVTKLGLQENLALLEGRT